MQLSYLKSVMSCAQAGRVPQLDSSRRFAVHVILSSNWLQIELHSTCHFTHDLHLSYHINEGQGLISPVSRDCRLSP